jgi:flavodoxin
MQSIIVYDSKHGKTKLAATKASIILKTPFFHVKDNPIIENCVIFLCPTYGDEELPPDMEFYLISLTETNKKFIICELGNYYGYDNYEFGAGKIIKNILTNLNWVEIYPMLSLDSLPKTDWNIFETWCERIKNEFY